jgi:hypothetical protein
MKNFTTPRIFTLTIAMVLLAGSLVQISATAGYLDAVSVSIGFVDQLMRSAAVVTPKETAPAIVDDAPLSPGTWDGNDTDAFWTSNGNWTGIGGAGAGDSLHFPGGASRRTNTNDFGVNTSFNSIQFEQGAGCLPNNCNYVINGNQMFIENGIVSLVNGGSAGPIFNANIVLGASQTFANVANIPAPFTFNGVVNLNTHTLTFDVGGGATTVMNGLINGTGGITKTGTGKLTINGDGNGFGFTNLNDGILEVGSSGTLGEIELNGGDLIGTGSVDDINGATASAGTIAPGNGGTTTGILTSVGFLNISAQKTVAVDLNGTTAGGGVNGYDRLNITGGGAALNGATLTVSMGFTATVGQQFTILQTTDTILTRFAQGTSIVAEGQLFTITYNPTSVVLTAQGTSRTWDGGGADNNWFTAANWSNDLVPLDGMDLIFPAGVPANRLSSFDTLVGLHVRTLTFGGMDYLINGDAVTLSDGIIVNTAATGTVGPIFNPNIVLTQP